MEVQCRLLGTREVESIGVERKTISSVQIIFKWEQYVQSIVILDNSMFWEYIKLLKNAERIMSLQML